MKKKVLIAQVLSIICFIFCFLHSYSQITFQKTYGGINDEGATSVHQTNDGGFIITGMTESFGAGGRDIYMVRTNSIGDIIWTKAYGGEGDDRAYLVLQTVNQGFIVAGITNSFGEGLYDLYIIHTDSGGDILWSKTYGGSNEEFTISIQQTSDSGFIIAGTTNSFGTGLRDIYILRINSSGDILWSKTYGGVSDDMGGGVLQIGDGGFIISGSTYSFGAGLSDFYLIRTDSSGNILWSKTYGGVSWDPCYIIQQTTDDGFIIGGNTNSFGEGLADFYLIRINNSGDTIWTKTYGGVNDETASSVQQMFDDGFIFSGYTESFGAGSADYFLVRTNSEGDTLWTKTYGSANLDIGTMVQKTSDGGFIMGGSTNSFGSGSNDIYLVKTDAMGNSGCNEYGTNTIVGNPATQVGSTATIVMDVTDSTQVSSTATVVTDVIPDTSTLCFNYTCNLLISNNNSLPDTLNTGVGIAWVSISGGIPPYTYQWNDPAMQTSDTAINLTAGNYMVTVTDSYGCTGSDSVAVGNVTGINDQYSLQNTTTIFPNPNNGEFSLIMLAEKKQEKIFVYIYNVLGEVLYYYENVGKHVMYFDISELSKGIYYIKIIKGHDMFIGKIIYQ